MPVTTSPVITPIRPSSAELGQGVAHLDRGAHGAERVVLVHDRDAEDGHHGVADELLDAAAMALHDRLHPLEVACEERAQAFGVERLAQRGRPGEIAEQHGDDLPLLVRRRRGRLLGAALGAEPERRFRLEAATRTRGHAASLGGARRA